MKFTDLYCKNPLVVTKGFFFDWIVTNDAAEAVAVEAVEAVVLPNRVPEEVVEVAVAEEEDRSHDAAAVVVEAGNHHNNHDNDDARLCRDRANIYP